MVARAEKRKLKEQEENQLWEILKFQNPFTKTLNSSLDKIEDPCHQGYTEYNVEDMIFD